MPRLFLLPMLISILVFAASWTVFKYIDVQKAYHTRRAMQPRCRPVLSRPVVEKPRC